MNIYCRNCGEKLENNSEICTKCNTKVLNQRIDVEKKIKKIKDYKKKENEYASGIIILSLLSFSLNYYLSNNEFVLYILPLLYLSLAILSIYSKIKMKESQKINILFISFVILSISFFIWLILSTLFSYGGNKGCFYRYV